MMYRLKHSTMSSAKVTTAAITAAISLPPLEMSPSRYPNSKGYSFRPLSVSGIAGGEAVRKRPLSRCTWPEHLSDVWRTLQKHWKTAKCHPPLSVN